MQKFRRLQITCATRTFEEAKWAGVRRSYDRYFEKDKERHPCLDQRKGGREKKDVGPLEMDAGQVGKAYSGVVLRSTLSSLILN